MGINNVKEANTFRDCILDGLARNGIKVCQKRPYSNDDLALVIRKFELPMDLSYAIRSMYHGYLYHTGIMWNGIVYSYMPEMDVLINAEFKDSFHLDKLEDFVKEGDTEIYYIVNTGDERNMIKSRLIDLVSIVNNKQSITEFNRKYGTGLSDYYNIFINNCEHVTMSVLIGMNFSCQAEKVYPKLKEYRSTICQYKSDMPEFAKIWINELYQSKVLNNY